MALLVSMVAPHRTPNRKVWKVAGRMLICAAVMLYGFDAAFAEEIQAPEYQVKAAFLYNFTKLVDWPTNAFISPSDPFFIGVLGRDPFGKELEKVIAGRTVQGRNIEPVRLNSVEAATNCHILYVSESERRRVDSIISVLKDKPILTVSDIKGFSSQGIIELVKTDSTINLSINPTAANRAGLVLSSRLLRLDKTLRPTAAPQTNSPSLKTVPGP